MTDYTHVATVGIGVAATASGAYLAQMNAPIGGTLVAIGLAILGYKGLANAPQKAPETEQPPLAGGN